MSELARFLGVLLLAAATAACGWFGRAYMDGTMISRDEAQVYAQGRADAAAEFGAKLYAAGQEKQSALARLQAAPKVVSRACPPGLGAVSDDVASRMRSAFQPQKK